MAYLFNTRGILDHPLTIIAVIAIGASLLATPIVAFLLRRARLVNEETGREIRDRHITSLLLAPLLVVPLLLCPASAIIAITVMSLLCNREFTKATGQFRERVLAAIVILSIVGVGFANLDNWPGLHAALPPLVITFIAGAAVIPDRPNRYIQRVAVATFGFLLFGSGLGHLGFIANDPNYRPILVLLIMSAQLSDIAAYCFGKAFGKKHLFPNTSPSKTVAGHVGAFLVIAPLSAFAAHFVFKGTDLDDPLRLGVLGLIIALGAQLGDLVLGSMKRDIGIKDMATTLPGHGGFLDRFNSLLIIAPAAFHYINHFDGFKMVQVHTLLEHMR
jgi:phosphatidate cytidylyltransferase